MEQEEKSTYKIIQPLMLSTCIAVGMMVGYKMNSKPDNSLVSTLDYPADSILMTGRVEELIRFVENKYVDKVDSDQLIAEALNGVFSKLDPHSLYLTPEETQNVNEQMDGAYNGIGIENFMIDDTVYISNVLKNTPAEKAGLQTFDRIISIDGVNVSGQKLDYENIRSLLKKQPGNNVKLAINRDTKKLNIDLTISEVEVKTVKAALLKDIKTLLIKIDRFGDNTYKEFMDEVEKYFTKNEAQHLILDLRDNPGGFLPEATNILCQIFAEKDRLLLYTEGRNNKKNEYKTNGKRFFDIDQVVVLIDENSASASEIIAGAIQDWDRGVIIGRRSYGKGLVQEQYNLTNGGAIRLTVARYFTPSGRCIQRDYSDREVYDHDYQDRQQNGDLFNKDSTLIKNGGKYFTQLLKREVSGSGGITPDVFISMDTLYRDKFYFSVSYLLPEFAFRYTSKYRKSIPLDVKSFASWELPDNCYKEFETFLKADNDESSNISAESFNNLKKEIKNHIRKFLFDKNGFSSDPKSDLFVAKAIDVIKNKITAANYK
ncbi:MAG: S41 family peptidase [Saprospiraceae bacterium]